MDFDYYLSFNWHFSQFNDKKWLKSIKNCQSPSKIDQVQSKVHSFLTISIKIDNFWSISIIFDYNNQFLFKSGSDLIKFVAMIKIPTPDLSRIFDWNPRQLQKIQNHNPIGFNRLSLAASPWKTIQLLSQQWNLQQN